MLTAEVTKTVERQAAIVQWALDHGYVLSPKFERTKLMAQHGIEAFQVMFGRDEEGAQVRLRFGPRSLKFERKVALSEEKKRATGKSAKWITVKSNTYDKIRLNQNGIDFNNKSRK